MRELLDLILSVQFDAEHHTKPSILSLFSLIYDGEYKSIRDIPLTDLKLVRNVLSSILTNSSISSPYPSSVLFEAGPLYKIVKEIIATKDDHPVCTCDAQNQLDCHCGIF